MDQEYDVYHTTYDSWDFNKRFPYSFLRVNQNAERSANFLNKIQDSYPEPIGRAALFDALPDFLLSEPDARYVWKCAGSRSLLRSLKQEEDFSAQEKVWGALSKQSLEVSIARYVLFSLHENAPSTWYCLVYYLAQRKGGPHVISFLLVLMNHVKLPGALLDDAMDILGLLIFMDKKVEGYEAKESLIMIGNRFVSRDEKAENTIDFVTDRFSLLSITNE